MCQCLFEPFAQGLDLPVRVQGTLVPGRTFALNGAQAFHAHSVLPRHAIIFNTHLGEIRPQSGCLVVGNLNISFQHFHARKCCLGGLGLVDDGDGLFEA